MHYAALDAWVPVKVAVAVPSEIVRHIFNSVVCAGV